MSTPRGYITVTPSHNKQKARLKIESIVMYMFSPDLKQTIITTSLSPEGKGFGVEESPEELDKSIKNQTQQGGE